MKMSIRKAALRIKIERLEFFISVYRSELAAGLVPSWEYEQQNIINKAELEIARFELEELTRETE